MVIWVFYQKVGEELAPQNWLIFEVYCSFLHASFPIIPEILLLPFWQTGLQSSPSSLFSTKLLFALALPLKYSLFLRKPNICVTFQTLSCYSSQNPSLTKFT